MNIHTKTTQHQLLYALLLYKSCCQEFYSHKSDKNQKSEKTFDKQTPIL